MEGVMLVLMKTEDGVQQEVANSKSGKNVSTQARKTSRHSMD